MTNNFPDWLQDLAPQDDSFGQPQDEPMDAPYLADLSFVDRVEEPEPEPEPDSGPLDDDLRLMVTPPTAADEAVVPQKKPRPVVKKSPAGRRDAMGLYAWQRFALSVFLLLDVLVVGFLFLAIFERMVFF